MTKIENRLEKIKTRSFSWLLIRYIHIKTVLHSSVSQKLRYQEEMDLEAQAIEDRFRDLDKAIEEVK